MGLNGKYYARELAENQTLENLRLFSDKLESIWKVIESNRKKLKRKTKNGK